MSICNYDKPLLKGVYYPNICKRPALESDPAGMCILHSRQIDKDLNAFNAAIKEKLDRKDFNFRSVYFPHDMFLFARQEFNFADFKHAEFTGIISFEEAIFLGDTNFSQAKFNELVIFFKAKFRGKVDFSISKFNGDVSFWGTIFDDRVIFSSTQFAGEANFERTGLSIADFSNLMLKQNAVITFQDMPMSYIQFAGTDLRRIGFNHVQWHSYRSRQALYDEVLLREDEKEHPWFWTWLSFYAPYTDPPFPWGDKYGDVERLYRYLRINYETQGDYKNSGDFHYGEMEMHRRASKWRWFPFYWYNLYWALSGYGERPLRALGWLTVFLLVTSGLVWFLDLQATNPQHLADFGESFIYTLQKVTLQRPTWAEPVGFWGNLVAGLSVLLIPGQAALFLLALRNRLGRRR